MIVLAGDIGGTKVDLGLFEAESLDLREQGRFQSGSFPDLERLCAGFLAGRDIRLEGAAFGIAGPIVDGGTETTNLPWVIERRSLEALLGCPVAMLNDLESAAHGIPALKDAEIHVLNEGRESPGGARGIIAAGTGLGEGYMVFDAARGHYLPAASEGGHSDFAPRNAREIDLLGYLLARYGHVSVERVVSGMGIVDIFGFLASTGRYDVPRELREEACGPEGAAVISKAALERRHPICLDTMRQFVASYGAEAGNLALKIMALGGLYVGGGIAPKILPLMSGGLFMESFTGKGRFAPLLRRVPVRIILNERAPLLGAARVAAELARRSSRGH